MELKLVFKEEKFRALYDTSSPNYDSKAIDDYVERMKSIKDVKYVYDNEYIKYYEGDVLEATYRWRDIVQMHTYEGKTVEIYFRNPAEHILIPESMALVPYEYQVFIAKASSFLPPQAIEVKK
jgi:hypothetical protein